MANTGWLLVDRILRVLLGVLVGAWVARYLGPDRYGVLAYAVAWLAVFQIAVTLGADGIVVREVTQRPDDAGSILGTMLALRMAAGAVGWAAMCLIAWVMQPGELEAVAMMALLGAGLVFQSADTVDLWFQSQSQNRRSVAAKAAGYCGAAALKILLILIAAPLWTFALALLVDAVLAAAALRLAYRGFPSKEGWRSSGHVARRLMREAWPVLVSAVALASFARVDQIMLRELSTDRELGLYSAVLPFSNAWHMLPMAIYVGVLPALTSLREQAPAQYARRLQQLFSAMAWLGVAVAAVMAGLAGLVVLVLLGEAYEASATLLAIHAITNVFVFMGIAQSVAILSERTPHVALQKALVGLLASIAFNFYAIPRWGALGAAWAAVSAALCAHFLINLVIARPAFVMQCKALFVPLASIRRREQP